MSWTDKAKDIAKQTEKAVLRDSPSLKREPQKLAKEIQKGIDRGKK